MADINDHILEMRYDANPKVLDYRGAWADAISKTLDLPHWQIDDTRIDVYDTDHMHHAFASVTNAGYTTKNAATRNYFSDKALKFLRVLFGLEGFLPEPNIVRLGVRSRFCRAFEGTFEELVERYSSRMLSFPMESLKALDATITDIGSPITMKDKIGTINFMGGPMEKRQSQGFFQMSAGLPEVGLVVDIDYWKTPNSTMKEAEVVAFVKESAEASYSRFQRVCQLVTGTL